MAERPPRKPARSKPASRGHAVAGKPSRGKDKPTLAAKPQRSHKKQRNGNGPSAEKDRDRAKTRKPSGRADPNHRTSSEPPRQRSTRSVPAAAPKEGLRIAKAIARAGLCSRRDAERWIADGRVTVNGKLLKTPACDVTRNDVVRVDGQLLPEPEPARLWRYYKPKGLVTSHGDPQGRPTVFEKLPPEMPRVISIGRLDFNTEGLLLLTNDGELARYLELPTTGWLRRYRVRAKGRVPETELTALQEGVTIDGVAYGPVEANVDSVQGANTWLTIAIREGKNREVRKICTYLGLTVNRLIRVSFGPFKLLDLAPGAVEAVKRRVLVEQLGTEMAQRLGLSESVEDRKARHARGRGDKPDKQDH